MEVDGEAGGEESEVEVVVEKAVGVEGAVAADEEVGEEEAAVGG